MAYTGNSPEDRTVLRLQARKSFALGLWIVDQNRNPLDIADCDIRIVARKNVPSTTADDSANLITNSSAIIAAPASGLARFELQAADLDWTPGEYQFAIVLMNQGYSSIIVKGVIQLEQNTEFSSIAETYSIDSSMSTALTVLMREQAAIEVRTGPTLAPGEATFTDADEQHLDELYAGAVLAGATITADNIPDGVEKVMMTVAERAALADLSLEWDDIIGKPAFGTASLQDVEYFLRPLLVSGNDITSGVISENRIPIALDLRGISAITSAPPGGNPGFIYLKYTP